MLVVLRGNSGSGKSTVARALQQVLDPPTAVLGQDHFRRVVYGEREQTGSAHAGLLEVAAIHALAAGQHVVLDGIFNAARYAPMLERIAARTEDARFFAWDLTFAETVRRHGTRRKSASFSAEEMRGWYHAWQPLPFVDEERIGPDETVDDVVRRVLAVRPAGPRR